MNQKIMKAHVFPNPGWLCECKSEIWGMRGGGGGGGGEELGSFRLLLFCLLPFRLIRSMCVILRTHKLLDLLRWATTLLVASHCNADCDLP